jgi:hypothetical protein
LQVFLGDVSNLIFFLLYSFSEIHGWQHIILRISECGKQVILLNAMSSPDNTNDAVNFRRFSVQAAAWLFNRHHIYRGASWRTS